MFGAIAPSYDLNNRVHSLGLDQRWRRFAVRQAGVKPGEVVLDAACGTGDLSRAFASAGAARVIGLDFTPEMLNIARSREDRRRADGASTQGAANASANHAPIEYIEGDAMALPLDDASVDIVSIAFGIRNVSEPAKALAEFFRVLRPGGRLVVLEFDTPTLPLIGFLARLYTNRIMPITATLISGDRSGAYRYLPASVESFMDRHALGRAITQAGFADLRQHPLTFGQCICHVALRREAMVVGHRG